MMWIGTNARNIHPASIFMVQDEGSRPLRNVATHILNYNLSYR